MLRTFRDRSSESLGANTTALSDQLGADSECFSSKEFCANITIRILYMDCSQRFASTLFPQFKTLQEH